MPQKRLAILHKVSNRVSLFIARVRRRRPIIPKLVMYLNKARKLKRFKLLKRNYNKYGFLEEYEFSVSSTPPFHSNKRWLRSGMRCGRNLYSMLVFRQCLGGLKMEEVDYRLSLEALPAAIDGIYSEPLDLWNEDQDSVDQRAEMFIERFYHEMRLQRHESTEFH